MIVYGDPQYEERLPTIVEQLRERITGLLERPRDAETLQHLRAALIFAGQVEQAAYDALDEGEHEGYCARLHEVTGYGAQAFCAAWAEQNGVGSGGIDSGASLSMALTYLSGPPAVPNVRVLVKIPEGFAFYTLYPEQYCAAALRWLSDHETAQTRKAAVVGIRSIGTTLAAVVAATLRAHGWDVVSITARPTGHPFQREVTISAERVEGAEWGLVVDEGPGLSGSSMSGVGQALVGTGLARTKISFLPAHINEPGSVASEEVRAWWSSTPRYVVPLEELRFGGLALPEALAAWLSSQDERDPVTQVKDVSGGQWRRLLYQDSSTWPAACAPFERTKYLCTTRSGRRVLFKFQGLCAAPGSSATTSEVVRTLLAERAGAGWTPAPLGVIHGFVATEWVEGNPLRPEGCTPDLLRHMARYIAVVAGPGLSKEQQEAGTKRLTEMFYWNTWEALGEEVAQRTPPWAVEMQAIDYSPRSYGDGRMAPHEWIRTHDGRVLKTDSAGYSWDHTCIGTQPVAWDIAGAIVEWGLDEQATGSLLEAFYSEGGEAIPTPTMAFYRMAYAAFRAGQCHLCANMSAHDPAEQERLWSAYNRYKEQLAELLILPS
ncbi:MAG: hypothetical protein M3328_05715 [Chloroflexota bacterium]|nr:hypothetical protein [Chloroflexota bacterium]